MNTYIYVYKVCREFKRNSLGTLDGLISGPHPMINQVLLLLLLLTLDLQWQWICIYIYTVYKSWDAPTLNSSHHQDYFIFGRGSPKTFICHCYWVGGSGSASLYRYISRRMLRGIWWVNKYAQGIWWVFYSKTPKLVCRESPLRDFHGLWTNAFQGGEVLLMAEIRLTSWHA